MYTAPRILASLDVTAVMSETLGDCHSSAGTL